MITDAEGKGPPTQEADLYKSGIYLFMDTVNAETCKEAIEFVLKQNIEKKKQKRLQFMICSPGGAMPDCFALIDIMKGSRIPIHTVGLGCIASCGLFCLLQERKDIELLHLTHLYYHINLVGAIGEKNMSCLHKSKSLSCLPRECWITIKSVPGSMKNRLENTCCRQKMYGCLQKKLKN